MRPSKGGLIFSHSPVIDIDFVKHVGIFYPCVRGFAIIVGITWLVVFADSTPNYADKCNLLKVHRYIIHMHTSNHWFWPTTLGGSKQIMCPLPLKRCLRAHQCEKEFQHVMRRCFRVQGDIEECPFSLSWIFPKRHSPSLGHAEVGVWGVTPPFLPKPSVILYLSVNTCIAIVACR